MRGIARRASDASMRCGAKLAGATLRPQVARTLRGASDLRTLGVPKGDMAQTARVSALLKRSVVAVSTKLSIAVVLGLAAIPLLPHDAASRLGWPGTQTAPIELVAAKPVPLGEASASDPTRPARRRPAPPDARAAGGEGARGLACAQELRHLAGCGGARKLRRRSEVGPQAGAHAAGVRAESR